MSELHCPYCGFNCVIPSATEEKIECPSCRKIFLYIQQSKSHGTIDYRPSPEINDSGVRQMSKLKVCHCNEWHNEYTEFYLKSDVDKVIADKDSEIAELKEACNDKDDWCLHTLKENRHHKYKRCLNNAWWCRKSSNAYAWNASNHRGWKIAEYYDKKAELYRKWHERWFELADKFKAAK